MSDNAILDELKFQTQLMKAELALLTELKYAVLNTTQKQTIYTIPADPEK